MPFSPKNIAFGLDIGGNNIKLAECKAIKNIRGQRFLMLNAINEVQLPEGSIIGGEIKNPPAVVQAIKKCIKTARGSFLFTKTVIGCLPESQCYFKIIAAPNNNSSVDIHNFINNAIQQHFPLEKNKFYYDWKYIDSSKIAIGASHKNIVDSYTGVIEQAGLIPISLEMESIAISRALINKKEMAGAKHRVFMDLGASHSSIIVASEKSPILTLNIPLSGNNFTKTISKRLKISIEDAEKTKIGCGFDLKKCPTEAKKIMLELISASTDQIKIGLQYINRFLKYKVDKIYISGGLSTMANFSSILSEKLKIKVRHSNPLTNVRLNKKINITNERLYKYVTAIGLAIKGTENNSFKKR